MTARDLTRVRRAIGAVRAIFICVAVGWGVLAVIISLAVTDKPDVLGDLVAALVITVVAIIGAIRAAREPFFWSLTLAVLTTSNLILALSGEVVPGPIQTLIVIGSWGAVATTAGIRPLLRRHPDLRGARALRGEPLRDYPVEPGEASARADERLQRGRDSGVLKVVAIVSGLVVVAVIGGLTWFSDGSRLDHRTEAFEAAWNGGRAEDLTEFFRAESREEMERGVREIMERRAWERLPRIEPSHREEAQDWAVIWYSLEGGELRTRWKLVGREWVLTGIKPPAR